MSLTPRSHNSWRTDQSQHAQPNNPVREWGLHDDVLNKYPHGDLVSYFPPFSQALIKEIHAETQAFPPMIATLALGAFAVGSQGLYDFQRPKHIPTSISISVLFMELSGKLKTTTINELFKPHMEFQRKVYREQDADSDYQAEQRVWKARVKACESRLRKHYDDSEKIFTLTQQLKEIMGKEPKRKKLATNILMKDTTKEELAHSLYTGSPSAAIVLDEASTFFKKFSNDPTSFNQFSDGADIKVDRRTRDSYFVEQPRLSLILAAQPRPMRKIMDEKGLDLIEIGFLPRMLIGISNQGNINV